MTCKEKLQIERPEAVNNRLDCGTNTCPHAFGYLDRPDYCPITNGRSLIDAEECNDCWDREIPEPMKSARDYIMERFGNNGERIVSEFCPSTFGFEDITSYCCDDSVNPASGCGRCWDTKQELPEDFDRQCARYIKGGTGDVRKPNYLTMGDDIKPCAYQDAVEKLVMDNGRDDYDGFAIIKEPRILDSGDRTEFSTGAVRDMREGKGRCDLLPLDVVMNMYHYCHIKESHEDQVFADINAFMSTGYVNVLFEALRDSNIFEDPQTMLLEVAKHFEEGAKKYGDNNWRKGIPVRCYIDSAVRHYLKFLRGDKDEPHDRAFCWNILCCIWTCKHMPELNDYRKGDSENASEESGR